MCTVRIGPPKQSTQVSRLEKRLKFTDEAMKYRQRIQGRRKGTEEVFKCFNAFVALAWSPKHTQARCRSGSSAADRTCVDEFAAFFAGRSAVQTDWPNDLNIPNFVTGRQYAAATKLYGVPAALSLCMEEMNHNLYKLRHIH
jgi:hypothetical protein